MTPEFVFVVCQNGAEQVCKQELLENHPELRLAFSRPGFLTFKVTNQHRPEQIQFKSTFARTFGWSTGNSKSTDADEQVAAALQQFKLRECDQIHSWQRDLLLPGKNGFEPGPTPLSEDAGQRLMAAVNRERSEEVLLNRGARANQRVFDLILVEPDQWWFGYHCASTRQQRWPGGVPIVRSDTLPVSRAWFKLLEALRWSGIRVSPGDVCCEIGASPGGACQLLLQYGAKVLAVDPAEMDPEIAAHENLTHLRCRGREIRKKDLKEVRWLISDINAAPAFTLAMISDIVTNQHVRRVAGLILTLKLPDWSLAAEIPKWREQIANLGFGVVKTRQLAFNRREICLVAVRDRYAQRASRKDRQEPAK